MAQAEASMVESESSMMVAQMTPILKEKKKRKRKKRPLHKSKMITGYIIYASEIRKDVIKKYPDRDFGDISKLVGIEWKNLPQETKVAYEKRAQEQNAKSKAIAAEAVELKKLADAAEERAIEQSNLSISQSLPDTQLCNGYMVNGHNNTSELIHESSLSKPMTHNSNVLITSNPSLGATGPCGSNLQTQSHSITTNGQQAPLQIIQQHQQPSVTTVQYCNTNNATQSQQPYLTSHGASTSQQLQSNLQIHYQRNNIVYRKPSTVRLRPKDSSTQTDSIEWVESAPRKPLRFSDKFMEYLYKKIQIEKQSDSNDDVMSIET